MDVRPHNVPIIALAVTVYGAVMLAFPEQYTSGSYAIAFELARPRFWGLGFMCVGLAALVYPKAITASALASAVASWTVALTLSVISGDAPTLGGPITWSALCACLVASITRHGVGR